jgi:hypothetical protein
MISAPAELCMSIIVTSNKNEMTEIAAIIRARMMDFSAASEVFWEPNCM